MIKHIACASADQLQCPFRKDLTGNNFPHHGFGQVTGHRCGFNNSGHSCQEIHRNFFQHSPNREIECVDMYSNAFPGYKYMRTHETVVLSKIMALAVDAKNIVGKFSAQRCVGK